MTGDVLIGMASPVLLAEYREYLDDAIPAGLTGLGGIPANHLNRELLQRGHRLVIFTLDPAVDREVILRGPRLRICIGPYRYKRARDLFRVERAMLVAAMRRERPTLVHAQWTYEFALAAIASRLPHLVIAHDAPLNVLWHNLIPYQAARTIMAIRAIRQARRLVAVSEHVAQHLKRFLRARDVPVIPNGLPASTFYQGARNLRDVVTFVTVLNGWGTLKNGTAAIDAYARFRAQYRQPSRLLMFGHGHGASEAAATWARARGLDEGIEFVGAVPHDVLQQRLIAECDVLVHPSLEEAHPMAVIEAMAKSLPIIGGASAGGVPAALGHGTAGVLVDVRSPIEICRAMLRVVEDRELARRLSRSAHALASERFAVARVADAVEREYDGVLRG